MQPNGVSSTSQTTNKFSITDVVSGEPELANAVVGDGASAAAAIGLFRTVSSSAAVQQQWPIGITLLPPLPLI